MSGLIPSPEAYDKPRVYEIRLNGHLGNWWASWFGGVTVILEEDGSTRLTGRLADQAALHGLLKKVRDIGMPLLSVRIVDGGEEK